MIEHNPTHSRQSFICAPFQLHFNQHLTLLKIKSIIKLHRQSEFWQMKAKKSKNWRYFCSQASIKILYYILLVPNDLFVLNGCFFFSHFLCWGYYPALLTHSCVTLFIFYWWEYTFLETAVYCIYGFKVKVHKHTHKST